MKKHYSEILFRLIGTGIRLIPHSLPPLLLKEKAHIVKLDSTTKKDTVYSYGVSLYSRDIAYAKCVAEAVERLTVKKFEDGGVAVGFDADMIRRAAVYELIERDAFMPYFLIEGIPVREIDKRAAAVHLKPLKIDLSSPLYNVRFFDITNDLQIPSIAVSIEILENHDISVGIKSNSDPVSALIGALEEAVLEITLKEMNTVKKSYEVPGVFSVKRFKDVFLTGHSHLYPLPGGNAQTSLRETLSRLKRENISISLDSFVPDIVKNSGYTVVRATSRDLQKVYFSQDDKHINKKRLSHIKEYFEKNIPDKP